MQLTLAQVVERLHQMHNDLAAAQRLLAQARDAEVTATEALRMASARALLAEDCPRPKRGENGVTVADRDAWLDRRVASERVAAAGAGDIAVLGHAPAGMHEDAEPLGRLPCSGIRTRWARFRTPAPSKE